MTTPASPALQSIGLWAWRLLPGFALLAAAMLWNLWSTSGEDARAIREGLHSHGRQWEYVRQITGKTLAR